MLIDNIKKLVTREPASPIIKISGLDEVNGFTIIELLFASTIFSLVLLGALAGFLRTGNLFYKGVSITQTQGVAKQVVDDVSGNISGSQGVNGNTDPSAGYTYYCIGSTRYTYKVGTSYQSSNTPNYTKNNGNYALVKDTLPSGCAAPCASAPCASGSALLNNPVEMLNDNMQLSQFLVCKTGSNVYGISVTVAYGDSGSLNPASGSPTCASPTFTAPSCKGGTQNQQFCAVTTLSTTVFAGVSA